MNVQLMKQRREELKIPQHGMAYLVGVAPGTYFRWENGETEPRASELVKLAEVLQVDVRDLLATPEPEEAAASA